MRAFPPWQRSGTTLNSETRNISRAFVGLNAEVASDAGFDLRQRREPPPPANLSTQQVFEKKTRLRCTCERQREPRSAGCEFGVHKAGC